MGDLKDYMTTDQVLDHIQQVTGGVSVEVNLTIAQGNIELAGQIATSWSQRAV